MESNEGTANSKIRWSSETNWSVAHGSLEASVAVDSFEDPIEEPDSDSTARRPPLILKPPSRPDSNPCEIKILFEQKHEISQIYVRSTARTYEVYYGLSPHRDTEYLCTIRCGVAERDGKILLAGYEDGSEDREESSSGGTCVSSEDDWVKIKEPEEDVKANRVNIIQEYYEATAQISDVDPCSVLTIRLLSLQDKNAIYVDEVYVFASEVQSTITGNEESLAVNSAQSSLMAMFVPALLHMSKSSAKRVQDKSASHELLMDDKIESSESVSGENQVNEQHTKPEELYANSSGSHSVVGNISGSKCKDQSEIRNLPAGNLERTLEQLASRASRVEDICLRFEEKLLKPIEKMEVRLQQLELQLGKLSDDCGDSNSTQWGQISEGLCLRLEEKLLKPIENMEARLQRVEVQLEKLENSTDCSSMRGRKFSAPVFSCSESFLSSSFNQGTHGTSEIEDFSCENLPDAASDLNVSAIVAAPELSHGEEDEEGNEDLKPFENPSNTNQKKTRSVDDALAAALSGFLLSTAKAHTESSSDPSDAADDQEVIGSRESHESCHNEGSVSDTEKGKGEPLQYTPMLRVKAPDFISEETGGDDHQFSALEIDSVLPKDHEDHVDEESNESIHGSESATEGNFPSVFQEDNSIKVDNSYNSSETLANSAPEGTPETEEHQVHDHKLEQIGDGDISATCFKEDNSNESLSSGASFLDFGFPILEVKFSSDLSEADTKATTPLETLLDDMSRLNIDASPSNATPEEDFNGEDSNFFFTVEAKETEDNFTPNNNLLLDLGAAYDVEEGPANSGSDSHYVISAGNLGASLI